MADSIYSSLASMRLPKTTMLEMAPQKSELIKDFLKFNP